MSKKKGKFNELNVRIIYWVIILLASSLFVIFNWNDCVNFVVLSGYNIIFCFWILIFLLPFIQSLTIGNNRFDNALHQKNNDSLRLIDVSKDQAELEQILVTKNNSNIKENLQDDK